MRPAAAGAMPTAALWLALVLAVAVGCSCQQAAADILASSAAAAAAAAAAEVVPELASAAGAGGGAAAAIAGDSAVIPEAGDSLAKITTPDAVYQVAKQPR